MPMYDRQKMLNLNAVPEATIIGVGGTGTYVAIFLAMSGTTNLHLMDSDIVEDSNLGRLPFLSTDLGRKKTEVAKAYIENIRPDCAVATYGRAGGFTLPMTDGMIFDCTDNQDTQLMVNKWAKEHNRPYIRCGYDGLHISVVDHIPKWRTGEPRTGYEIVPSWVVPAVMAAAFAVAKAMIPNNKINVTADIAELGA